VIPTVGGGEAPSIRRRVNHGGYAPRIGCWLKTWQKCEFMSFLRASVLKHTCGDSFQGVVNVAFFAISKLQTHYMAAPIQ
jgi:hypothetical protein